MSAVLSSFVPPTPVIIENLRLHLLNVDWSDELDDDASEEGSMDRTASREEGGCEGPEKPDTITRSLPGLRSDPNPPA